MQEPYTNSNNNREETTADIDGSSRELLNGNSVNGNGMNGNSVSGHPADSADSNGIASGGVSVNGCSVVLSLPIPVSLNGSSNSITRVNSNTLPPFRKTKLDPIGSKDIEFIVDEPRRIVVKIVDVLGIDQRIKLLLDDQLVPGKYHVFFKKGDNNCGLYFYKLYVEIEPDDDVTIFETIPEKPGKKYYLAEIKEVFI